MDIQYQGHKVRKDRAHRLWLAMALAYTQEHMSVAEIINDPRFKKPDGTKYNRAYIYQIFVKLKEEKAPTT